MSIGGFFGALCDSDGWRYPCRWRAGCGCSPDYLVSRLLVPRIGIRSFFVLVRYTSTGLGGGCLVPGTWTWGSFGLPGIRWCDHVLPGDYFGRMFGEFVASTSLVEIATPLVPLVVEIPGHPLDISV